MRMVKIFFASLLFVLVFWFIDKQISGTSRLYSLFFT